MDKKKQQHYGVTAFFVFKKEILKEISKFID
jgi:hypothetical protein